MSRLQTITRPTGPLDHDTIATLLRELGEQVPKRTPRPYTRRTRGEAR